jgi:hypothetical protein
MSILGVAIVPPHPTQLSLRMAVAFYVTGISTPEVHPEFPPLLGTLTRLFARGTGVAVALLVAFNVAMMASWLTAGPSRDGLVVAGWIAGDALLCLVALWATDR